MSSSDLLLLGSLEKSRKTCGGKTKLAYEIMGSKLVLTHQQTEPRQCPSLPAKEMPAMREPWVQSLDWEDPLEKGKAAHSNILAWRIPWTVQSTGLPRVRHD